jgi:two-component system, OmpR family, phosphate regulon sensor histidine kinase PhoR
LRVLHGSQMPEARDALIMAFPHAAILIDQAGLVVAHNAAAQKLHPLIRIDTPLTFAIRDPELLGSVRRSLEDGQTRRFEVSERLPIERAFAVQVAQAGNNCVLIVFDDLTAGRKLERMRVDFIANASHELRTPLASLLGFVETLRGPARDDATAREQFLGIMDVQARRMARLIDDLLSLSRIELNAHIRPMDRVDLVGVIRQVADALKPLAMEQNLTLQLDLAPKTADVLGDRDELLRVFDNLIENAIKYASHGKRIDISLARAINGDFVSTVRDYGPGISPEHLPRLTERFYRVDVAASRGAGGTGLGLALVKHIINRHRGQMNIESKPDEGTQFQISLAPHQEA